MIMRALEYTEFGGPDVLKLVEVPLPEPGPGQVRIAVKFAAVNAVDWKIREGRLGEQFMPQRPGVEVAGIVDAAGPNAAVKVGQEVFGWTASGSTQVPGWAGGFPAGGYADFAVAEVVIAKPTAMSWAEAASLPVAGETAVRGLHWVDPQPGEVVLVQGGSGMVGSIVVQLAVARGATVIATAGHTNADFVQSLGAIPVPYGQDMLAAVQEVSPRVDAAIDAAGLGGLAELIALRGGTERVVSLADPGAAQAGLPFLPGGPDGHNVRVLGELADMVLTGAVRQRPAKIFPLTEAAAAQRFNATGHAGGKVLLDVD